MRALEYIRFQIRDNRTFFRGYGLVYLVLLVLSVVFSRENDIQTLHDNQLTCYYIARTCILIMAAVPMIVLSAEIMENKNRPHVVLYHRGGKWISFVFGVAISLIGPFVYFVLSNLLFWKSIEYVNGVLSHTWIQNGIELLEYLVVVFLLCTMAFVIGMWTQNVFLSLMITLFYTLIMEFFSFDMFAREFEWLDVTTVLNNGGPGWWKWTLYWLIAGCIMAVAGLLKKPRS